MRRVLIAIAVVAGVLGVISGIRILALFVAATFSGHHVKRKTDVATVQKDIHDHLPIGGSRAAVEAYLDQRKIGHSYVGELKGLPNYVHSHTEMAMIRDVSEEGIIRCDIQILFKFDDSDSKLVNYRAQEICTGP
jgi:hypothetical protein